MLTSTLCHSSVREVVVPAFNGQENDLSLCSKTATDVDVCKKSTVSDGVSATTNSCHESVPTSSIAVPLIHGIYSSSQDSDESHAVKSAAEGCEFELDRESFFLFNPPIFEGSQGNPQGQCVVVY